MSEDRTYVGQSCLPEGMSDLTRVRNCHAEQIRDDDERLFQPRERQHRVLHHDLGEMVPSIGHRVQNWKAISICNW